MNDTETTEPTPTEPTNANETPKTEAKVFEVMVDEWGYDEHQVKRGDLIRAGSLPYDFDWATAVGVLREAQEFEPHFAAGLRSVTQVGNEPLAPTVTSTNDQQPFVENVTNDAADRRRAARR